MRLSFVFSFAVPLIVDDTFGATCLVSRLDAVRSFIYLFRASGLRTAAVCTRFCDNEYINVPLHLQSIFATTWTTLRAAAMKSFNAIVAEYLFVLYKPFA